MPRYSTNNLAALDPEYRRKNDIDAKSKGNSRYTYGNRVFVATGNKAIGNGFCIRLLPVYDSDAGSSSFVSLREGPESAAIGDWCRLLTVAHWVGSPGVCFITHDGNPELDPKENPYVLLYRAAWRAKQELNNSLGQLCGELLQSQSVMHSHIGSLRKPEKMLFLSGSHVYEDESGNTVIGAFSDDQTKNARVIALKFTATQSLFSALRARDDDGDFLAGNLLDISDAPLITVLPESYRSNEQKVLGLGENGQETFFCPPYAKGSSRYAVGYPAPDRRSAFTHFAFVHDTFNGSRVDLTEYESELIETAGSLDDHINVLSFEEQAKLLAGSFPREVLEYAWQGYPQYLKYLSSSSAPTDVGAGSDSTPAVTTIPVVTTEELAEEISQEEQDSVADMFSSPPSAAPKKKKLDPNDIMARAKSRTSAK